MWTKPVFLWIPCWVVFFLGPGALQAAQDPVQPAPPGVLVDVGGYRVHLYCTGSGSPTVVVLGAGFSFDWGLVQPAVARTTRVCTYDPSGTAWSDPPPPDPAAGASGPLARRMPGCGQRVAELHELLSRASIGGPYVIVGYSIGGLYGRLYARNYPEQVAGMVIVDHAFLDAHRVDPPPAPATNPESKAPPEPQRRPLTLREVDTPPVLLFQAPIELGLEDDRNFQRLPQANRDLHNWALSRAPIRPTVETAEECAAAVAAASTRPYPLGSRPLVVISTNNASPAYQALQASLLELSRDHKQTIAGASTHMVIIDAPETIVTAIAEVVAAVRTHSPLQK
ncbi:alpha/beta fold hydrolase [Paludibaculum fermentans]|uniref:alpha/beta fold hydrolase n=1 Tax=Paludibaculum fermentans TaxID=1473598 RepID=UPI003EBC5319